VIVTLGLLNRTETPIVPGGDTTGPAVTGPIIVDTGDPFSVGFEGLPPDGAAPSEPPRGELVMSDGGIHPWYEVYLFTDGRLIWARDGSAWIEQRLTPDGVELLRSGAVELGGQHENPGEQLPASAWEDPELRPYVPSRYMVCPWDAPKNFVSLLPPPARELVRGIEPTDARTDVGDWAPGCLNVTIEDARSLAEILTDAGFEEGPGPTGTVFFGTEHVLLAFDPHPAGRGVRGRGRRISPRQDSAGTGRPADPYTSVR
jgi:hypothetical protein